MVVGERGIDELVQFDLFVELSRHSLYHFGFFSSA